MDPFLATILVGGGLFGCGFYGGLTFCRWEMQSITHFVIETTIDNLIKDGFLATKIDEDGDVAIRAIDDVVREAVDLQKKM